MWQQRILTIIFLFVLMFSLIEAAPDSGWYKPCVSLEINKLSDFKQLRKCKTIFGNVRIANIQFTTMTNLTDFASDVEEIGGYLMIYRVHGLDSLETIFPRLTIIRGQELLFDRFSLVVFENRDLKNLGFISLLRIQNGFIRIENNPSLCFVETVNWVYLLGNKTKQHYSLKQNRSPNHCPQCTDSSEPVINWSYNDEFDPIRLYCWHLTAKQRHPAPSRFTDCPIDCGESGCDDKGVCCNRNCVSGCSINKCQLCAHLKNGAKCVEFCPTMYQLYKRECITATDCRKLGMIAYSGNCIDACPDSYKRVRDNKGEFHCELECSGDIVIRRAEDLTKLNDCITLHGSLTIELYDVKAKIITQLEKSLKSLNEITGFLKVIRSPQIMSLSFLTKLSTIRGDTLIDNKYALFVVDNHHLEEIWNPNQSVSIFKGTIYFHLNPRLCYEKITQLESQLRSAPKLSVIEVSPNSNGERKICGFSVHKLNVQVEDYNSTSVRLAVDILSQEELETLFGYSYHYKEAPIRNVTMYDGRHGCGHDDWLMDVSASPNCRHIISNLKPFTQYAFFVKTLTRTEYHLQHDAYSDIQYFRTMPSKPSPVEKIYAHCMSSTEIMLHWWPPRNPNGIITKYIINYEEAEPSLQNATIRKYDSVTKTPTAADELACHCSLPLPELSGPVPDDENFYNKDQFTYDEALPNLIYFSRSNEASKRKRYTKAKDVASLDDGDQLPVISNNITNATEKTKVKAVETSANNTNTTQTKKNATLIQAALEQAEINYRKYRERLVERAKAIQDTGIKDFPIVKPPKICNQMNTSVQYQIENACKNVLTFEGSVVEGNQHYFIMHGLKPEITYRVTVRACVENLVEGCSSETTILAETVSKSVEKYLNDFY